MSNEITIAIPTFNRDISLAVTLTSLLSQTYKHFDILISEQNVPSLLDHPSIKTVICVLKVNNHQVEIITTPQQGIAAHRQTILDSIKTKYVMFLDDDLVLEPFVVNQLRTVIQNQQCGFVGSAPIGLSYLDDIRPQEQKIEFWQEKVEPETIKVDSKEWQRYTLHNAANLYHVAQKLNLKYPQTKLYKLAWIGGCVLFDTKKLTTVGGFNFWSQIPPQAVGEDVVAQLKVLKQFGGCGVIPSGVYHQELPTTLPNRTYDAPRLLDKTV